MKTAKKTPAKKAAKKPAAKKSAKKTAQAGAEPAAEPHEFQAEVAKLLHLMVHSVYSEREVFLRELISNGADACDKLRYEAIAKPDLFEGQSDLAITISADKDAGTVTITDTGIGMSKDELIANLGTIARSGTQAFMEKTRGNEDNAVQLIGQFGIGFYSAFMVAEKVEVTSRKAGSDEAWHWVSDGTGKFTIAPAAGKDVARGTRIHLTLAKGAEEFAGEARLEHIVKTYSDHVAYPIMLAASEGEPRQINSASAIWARPKSDITEDQYKEFFGAVSGVYSDPALTLHYKAEGLNEYTVLLFVPEEQPFDLFDPARRGQQKLYVRRVYITDDAELLPAYLRFVRGVVDSEDMPLNISREMLQDNPTVAAIKKAVTNKVLSELARCADKSPETYAKIWKAFGAVIKEGLYEDMARRDKLFEIARFVSLNHRDGDLTLKAYVEQMKDKQEAIYYITGDDAEKIAHSPQLEGYQARGLDVLLFSDPVDGFWVRTALGFEGKQFRSVTQGSADLDKIDLRDEHKKDEAGDEAFGLLLAQFKETLGDSVKDVVKSSRLTGSPVCLVAEDSGLDRNLEKLLAQQNPQGAGISAPVLEINAGHALIRALAAKAKASPGSNDITDAAFLLFDEACLLEGEQLKDPQGFVKRLSSLMEKAL